MEGNRAQGMKDDEHGYWSARQKCLLVTDWAGEGRRRAEVGSIVSFLKEWGWGVVWAWEYGVLCLDFWEYGV